jgi:hypothetical protein
VAILLFGHCKGLYSKFGSTNSVLKIIQLRVVCYEKWFTFLTKFVVNNIHSLIFKLIYYKNTLCNQSDVKLKILGRDILLKLHSFGDGVSSAPVNLEKGKKRSLLSVFVVVLFIFWNLSRCFSSCSLQVVRLMVSVTDKLAETDLLWEKNIVSWLISQADML